MRRNTALNFCGRKECHNKQTGKIEESRCNFGVALLAFEKGERFDAIRHNTALNLRE